MMAREKDSSHFVDVLGAFLEQIADRRLAVSATP